MTTSAVRILVPHTYPSFACKASACRHTCCVGWEIDIDPATLARYESLPGPVGDRLRAGIDRPTDGSPCFRLTADERCPNLDENGLCTIISDLGEEALCGICRDHPRFRNYLPDGTIELGLGLCCEAACALLLGAEEPMHLVPLPEPAATRERAIAEARDDALDFDDEESAALLTLQALRDHWLTIITDRTSPLGARLIRMVSLVGELTLPAHTWADWADCLADLERLDPAWDTCLTALHAMDTPVNTAPLISELQDETAPAYEHLLAYFLYRYMTSRLTLDYGTPALPLAFAIASTALIHATVRAIGIDVCEIARMYSSEIEYSEDNRDALWDELAAAFV